MTTSKGIKTIVALTAVAMGGLVCNIAAHEKPMKVYILAGQSNMQGTADIATFDYIGHDPATAPMLKEMRGADGKPRVCEKVWISHYTKRPRSNKLDSFPVVMIVGLPMGSPCMAWMLLLRFARSTRCCGRRWTSGCGDSGQPPKRGPVVGAA